MQTIWHNISSYIKTKIVDNTKFLNGREWYKLMQEELNRNDDIYWKSPNFNQESSKHNCS